MAIGDNHQVLAYAYEQSAQVVTLYVYDPNVPNQEVQLTFDVHDTTGEVHVERRVAGVLDEPHRDLRDLRCLTATTHTPHLSAGYLQYSVYGAIGLRYRLLQSAVGPLGACTSPDETDATGGGRVRRFANGVVTWHPTIGAYAIWGEIGRRFDAIGGAGLRLCAVRRVNRARHERTLQRLPPASRGRRMVDLLEPGNWRERIYGGIRDTWLANGGAASPLGLPTADEADREGGGRVQSFEYGTVEWTEKGGVVVVR